MNDDIRAQLVNALIEIGVLFPDWRMGQTLANLAMAAGRPEPSGIWDLEDDEALIAARRLIERNSGRTQAQTIDANKKLAAANF